MGMQKFRAPALPVPPAEYDQMYHTQLIRILSNYFSQLDSTTPTVFDAISLKNLPTEADLANLREGTVYRDTTADNVLKVKV